MRVVVLRALGRAALAGLGAQPQRGRGQRFVRAGAPDREAHRHVAHFGAIEAFADALAHHRHIVLGDARIGAAGAGRAAEHRVAQRAHHRFAQRLADIGMQADHFRDRHGALRRAPNENGGAPPMFRLSRRRCGDRFAFCSGTE
jgi:hypothetical protein